MLQWQWPATGDAEEIWTRSLLVETSFPGFTLRLGDEEDETDEVALTLDRSGQHVVARSRHQVTVIRASDGAAYQSTKVLPDAYRGMTHPAQPSVVLPDRHHWVGAVNPANGQWSEAIRCEGGAEDPWSDAVLAENGDLLSLTIWSDPRDGCQGEVTRWSLRAGEPPKRLGSVRLDGVGEGDSQETKLAGGGRWVVQSCERELESVWDARTGIALDISRITEVAPAEADSGTESTLEDAPRTSAPASDGPRRLLFEIHRGTELLRTEHITREIIKVGNLPTSHIELSDPKVSAIHAVIEVTDDDIKCSDLGSPYGTWFEGQRVTNVSLSDGDALGFGQHRVVLRVERAQREPKSTPPPASGSGASELDLLRTQLFGDTLPDTSEASRTIDCFAVDPSGELLLILAGEQLEVWPLPGLERPVAACTLDQWTRRPRCSFSQDGSLVAVSRFSKALQVSPVEALDQPLFELTGDVLSGFVIDATADVIALASQNGYVAVTKLSRLMGKSYLVWDTYEASDPEMLRLNSLMSDLSAMKDTLEADLESVADSSEEELPSE